MFNFFRDISKNHNIQSHLFAARKCLPETYTPKTTCASFLHFEDAMKYNDYEGAMIQLEEIADDYISEQNTIDMAFWKNMKEAAELLNLKEEEKLFDQNASGEIRNIPQNEISAIEDKCSKLKREGATSIEICSYCLSLNIDKLMTLRIIRSLFNLTLNEACDIYSKSQEKGNGKKGSESHTHI